MFYNYGNLVQSPIKYNIFLFIFIISEILKREKKEEKFIDLSNEDNVYYINNNDNIININNEDYEINNVKKTLVIDILAYKSKYTDSQNNLFPRKFRRKKW